MEKSGLSWPKIRDMYRKYDLSEIMQAYFVEREGLRPKRKNPGLRTMRSNLYQFFRHGKIKNIDAWFSEVKGGRRDIRKEFSDYLRYMTQRKELSDNSIKAVRVAFVNFAKIMHLGPLDLTPIKHVSLKRTIQPFTREDIQDLLAVANSRERMAILVAVSSGARISEMAGLIVEDLKEIFERKEPPYAIRVKESVAKGFHGYVTFVTEEAAEQLRIYIKVKGLGEKDTIFLKPGAIQEAFRRLRIKTRMKGDRVFHSLRKYTRTVLAASGIPEPFVEKMIGHHSGSIEQIYTAPNVEQLRTYYAQAMPSLCFFGGNDVGRTKELQSEVELLKSERNAILERLNKLEKFYSIGLQARPRLTTSDLKTADNTE